MTVPKAFEAAIDLLLSTGARSIKDLLGCWEYQIDEHWWIAMNGHKIDTACSTGMDVPPFSCYIEFNGWPAGIVDTYGGAIAAGALANEETFLAAVEACKKRST